MKSDLKRTQFYFLVIAILSLFVILLSFKWQITETVYKISSHFSQLKISNIHLSGVSLKAPVHGYNRYFPDDDAKSISPTQLTTKHIKELVQTEHTSLKDTKGFTVTTTNMVINSRTAGIAAVQDEASVFSKDNKQFNNVKELVNDNNITNYTIDTEVSNVTDNFKTSVSQPSTKYNDKNTTTSMALQEIDEYISNLRLKKPYGNSTLNMKEWDEMIRKLEDMKRQLENDNSKKEEKIKNTGEEKTKNTGTNSADVKDGYDTMNTINTESLQEGTTRPDQCTDCFQTRFKKIINEPGLCIGPVDILILITSTVSNKNSRDAIRSTWCNICKQQDSGIKCLFVFGNRNNSEENAELLEESQQHHDIIQMDFYDVYANLTYKTISALQWSKDHCHQAKFVMKTDDDMYVNTELIHKLVKVVPSKDLIGGYCWGPSSPHRDVNSKWHVSFKQYRHSLFPSLCSGTGYIMSRDVVAEILRQSPNIPYFHLEDVYVAICVQRIGIRPKLIDGFSNTLTVFDACTYRNQIFTSHGLNADSLKYIWQQTRTCPSEYIRPSELYRATNV